MATKAGAQRENVCSSSGGSGGGAFGETSELSELSVRLAVIAPDRLGGSALLAAHADGRKVVGSGGAILELSR